MKEAKTSIGKIQFNKNLAIAKLGGWILVETVGASVFLANPSVLWGAALSAGASAIALNALEYSKYESLLEEESVQEINQVQKVKKK